MFTKKTLLAAAAPILIALLAVLILASFPRVSRAKPDKTENSQPCYNLASLQGSYAIVGDYGAHVAILLDQRHMDGKGNLTGTFLINEPGATPGTRTLVTGTEEGTYTVNCDGLGVSTRTVMVTDGATTAGVVDNFMVTKAVVKRGQFLATALQDAQQVPSVVLPGGVFLTRTWTRLPGPDQEGDSE